MPEKLKDYQVLNVFCGGTFYKVRHKVTNNIFAWKAYNCSAYSEKQIQEVVNEVKTISKVISASFLRYYDTILHGPSKTLYFVLEYNSWQSLRELVDGCGSSDKYIAEKFIWHLLFELARVCKRLEDLRFVVLQKCITSTSIFVNENGEIRVNCFDLTKPLHADVMRQVGDVIYSVCFRPSASIHPAKEHYYSDDLTDVINLLTDDQNINLSPDVILYHPTVLSNVETLSGSKPFTAIQVTTEYTNSASDVNKCDSEKAVELYRVIEPLPRTHFNVKDSPIYSNIIPKNKGNHENNASDLNRVSLSPTLAALALELPGFVPRSRRPYAEALEKYNSPQRVSEETLSQQWISRLIALRQREESLNMRERDLTAKEIVSSPATKIVSIDLSHGGQGRESNGITLPPMVTQAGADRSDWVSRRRQRRASSTRVRSRRKSYAYEDLDSSLSADAGDASLVITAAKITKENMPRRNIFPDVSTKKVHFTAANPFTESDDSVTLTFYELEGLDCEGYQVPRAKQTSDITRFKYLDLEKITSEKRAAVQGWAHSSPSKQPKTSNIFGDITNVSSGSIRKTPSKSSLTSKSSNASRLSMLSSKSHWSMESSNSKVSDNVCERTRSSARLALSQTPAAPPEAKKSKRKSLLPFKTPFKFKTSTKV